MRLFVLTIIVGVILFVLMIAQGDKPRSQQTTVYRPQAASVPVQTKLDLEERRVKALEEIAWAQEQQRRIAVLKYTSGR